MVVVVSAAKLKLGRTYVLMRLHHTRALATCQEQITHVIPIVEQVSQGSLLIQASGTKVALPNGYCHITERVLDLGQLGVGLVYVWVVADDESVCVVSTHTNVGSVGGFRLYLGVPLESLRLLPRNTTRRCVIMRTNWKRPTVTSPSFLPMSVTNCVHP